MLSKALTNSFSSPFKFVIKRSKMISFFARGSSESEDSIEHDMFIKRVQKFIPQLTCDLRKGNCGRIGIVGGSFEYTGAPYFAAISSLKLGADLIHVFCCKDAGPVIKSYSPELMVHPFLDSENITEKIEPWLEKLNALVIGPGLGKEKGTLKNVREIITFCKEKLKKCLPLVIDADGLHIITENPNFLKGYKGPVILTPNSYEFKKLSDKMPEKDPFEISVALNVILLQKGSTDVITNGIYNNVFKLASDEVTIVCDISGSNRRCGGQGDVLAGCIATFVAWLELYLKKEIKFDFTQIKRNDKEWFMLTLMSYSYAVYAACVVTRTCGRLAFEANGRGMTASDMISFINRAFQMHFGP